MLFRTAGAGALRRRLRNSVAQVEGLTWYTGAISCAEWEGVALRDVLEYATWQQFFIFFGADGS